jgi:heat-inducible transcriptional repressor
MPSGTTSKKFFCGTIHNLSSGSLKGQEKNEVYYNPFEVVPLGMNNRQKKVLSAVVELYTETALPVGSQALLEHFDFPVSSATLRSDMVTLEEEGYLYQPHVSAGRIPTDQGYRIYVEEMMGEETLPRRDQERLQRELLMLKAKHVRLGRTTAKLLSALSGNLAVSGIVGEDEFYDFGMKELIEKPEFKEIDELCRLVETLDSLDEKLDGIMLKLKDGETHIFIGDENPVSGIDNCSMIVAPYQNREGERGMLAIIGPKRMKYAKNKSLIEYMRKLLNSSLVVILIGNVIYLI